MSGRGRNRGWKGGRKDLSHRIPIWGINPVIEFLKNHPEAIHELLILPSFGKKKRQKTVLSYASSRKIKTRTVSDFNKMDMPQGAVHQGVVAIVQPVWSVELQDIESAWQDATPLVVVCDEVTDPGNLGAIIRAAAAFGAHAVILSHRNSAEVNGTVVKASAGAVLHTKICTAGNTVKSIKALQELGILAAALTVQESRPVWDADLTIPTAIVLGAEGRGLRHIVVQNCDTRLHIPQSPDVESLNVASACTAVLYETARQRTGV